MKLEIVSLFFIMSYQRAYAQKEVYGSECDPPIKCVNSTTFAFCVIIDGSEELVGNQTCLKGQICSTLYSFHPCVDDITTVTYNVTTTTNAPTTKVSPPNCDVLGSGMYPASECNKYYKCSKTLWWWDADLKTCPKKKAFSRILKKCVPLDEAECAK